MSSRGVNIISHGKKAGSSPAPFCCTVFGGAPSQRVCNPVRLQEGLGFASPSRLRKPVCPPVDHLTRPKVHGDDLGHVVVLKFSPSLEACST
jgi:hypothetical protein